VSSSRRGFLLGLAAYVMWGGFPLYWPLLEPAGSLELLAHRVLWSVVTLTVLVLVLGRTRQFAVLFGDRRVFLLLLLASAVISVNWGTYIYGVTSGRVVETSLGYFINPLVTVLMGVLVIGERLRPLQWLAMSVGVLACLVLTLDYGRPPWIALVLALSFGTYGLAKKQAGVEAVESLTLETLLVSPLAIAYLGWLVVQGDSTFASNGVGHALLLMSAGLVTAVPLLCFGAAAIRVSMVTLGLLQYLAPVLQFFLGVVYFHEDMTGGRWIGFGLVWVALAVFTVESVRHRQRQLRLAAEAVAV
jgi:chloramphenicol-sensitive protein RarD